MVPEWKEKWVKALRGGKYEKGKSYLRQKGKNNQFTYDCLGVLCDIMDKRVLDSPSSYLLTVSDRIFKLLGEGDGK